MEKKLFGIGILVLVLVIGMMLVGCDNENNNQPQSVIFTGTANGVMYTLKITQNSESRSVYSPTAGDIYELTIGSKKSNGSVVLFTGGIFTLRSSVAQTITFTVTVSGSSISNISGTITWNDNSTTDGPGSINGGNNNEPEEHQIYWLNNPTEVFTGSGTVITLNSMGGDPSRRITVGSITNGKFVLNLPQSVSDDLLELSSNYLSHATGVTVSPVDLKTTYLNHYYGGFGIYEEALLWNMNIIDSSIYDPFLNFTDSCLYVYSNKAGTISGQFNFKDSDWDYTEIWEVNLKQGWNKIWVNFIQDHLRGIMTYKTDLSGMPTDIKWLLSDRL